MPTGHHFPINCRLLRRMDRRQMSTHVTHINKCGKLTRWGQEGGRSQKGLGKMGVETLKVTRDGDSYLVSLRGRIREQTSERSRDSMTEM